GSPFRIGDVIVPATWTDAASRSFAVDPGLLAEAETVAASAPALERCTPVPPNPPSAEVCLPHVPGVIVGGSGQSSDPFGGKSPPCQPGGGEIFGCDTEALATAREESAPVAIDEESAAVAALASAHRVPFLVVPGVAGRVGQLVARACALRARAADMQADRLARRAAVRFRHAAALVRHRRLPSCCAAALAARLRAAAAAVSAGQ